MSTVKRYVILTPFDRADVVASIAYLHHCEVDVARAESGVVILRDIPVKEYQDWDIAELLGEEPQSEESESEEPETHTHTAQESAEEKTAAPDVEPDTALDVEPGDIDSDNGFAVAQIFSRLSRYGVVLFQVELGDDVGGEEGVSGLVRAQRVVGGKAGEEIPAGLLLNSLDPALEQIVLGLKPIDEVDPHVIHAADAEQVLESMMEDPQ